MSKQSVDHFGFRGLAGLGQLVELVLRTDAFVHVDVPPNTTGEENTPPVEQSEEGEAEAYPNQNTGLAVMAFIGLVSILGLLVVVEIKGKR